MKGGAAALALSRELALMVDQNPNVRRVSENVVEVRSRNKRTPECWYRVVRGLDGSLICSCIASFYPYRGECWHLNKTRKVFDMTTETSKALVPIVVQPPPALLHTQHDLDVIKETAAIVFAGNVSLPKELNSPQKVAAVMLYGLELGLRPMTAIQHLYIVDGKVAASAQVMVGLCMNKEKDIEFHVEQLDESICTIRMIRPSRRVNETRTITWEQIEKAGLARGNNLQYPEDRLAYHTVKRLCRLYAPDLINGLADGVPVAGISEAPQWRVEEADLYNEGDVPDNVDRETGEIREATQQAPVSASAGRGEQSPVAEPAASSPATATDGQVVAMNDWSSQIKELDAGAEKLKAIDATRRERWSYAVNEGRRWLGSALTEADADAYLVLLREAYEAKAPEVQQPALTP